LIRALDLYCNLATIGLVSQVREAGKALKIWSRVALNLKETTVGLLSLWPAVWPVAETPPTGWTLG
jgi:hypothetical protein